MGEEPIMTTKLFTIITILALLVFYACSDNTTNSDSGTPPEGDDIPQSGLVGEYSFNGSANDGSTNNNHGMVYGATLVADRDGNSNSAYFLDGVDDSIVIPESVLNDENNISVSLWIKCPLSSHLKYFYLGNDFGIWQKNDSVGIAITLDGMGTNSAWGDITPDQWVHMSGTYNGDTIKAYVNGLLAMETSWSGAIADNDRNMIIGFFNQVFWEGTIDDIRIYNRTLSPEAIDSLFNE